MYHVFIPTNSLLLSKGCFLLLLLKTRACTEYKVLKFQYVIICWFEENDYKWTDARRPVPWLWIRSAEVRGGGGVGTSLGKWEHTHTERLH